ncbi:hypothetical protein BsWGS_10753 [Bradybaena similaris]
MGKKVEKSISKEKQLASPAHPEDIAIKPGEPYKCSGNFQLDFTQLCKYNQMPYIPPVVLRPKVPVVVPGSDIKIEKKPEKKHQTPIPELEFEEQSEYAVSIERPKTYITQDKFRYFMPTVQVELDIPERWETVTEIYVRGWKIDEPMMEVFQQCLPALNRLHTINLWNTGLTEKTVRMLSKCLQNCQHLKNVVLDGNPVKEENWYEFLLENSLIQNLSLRHCRITDKGAARLGTALGNVISTNRKLISLNLSGNFITDDGAEHLAGGLRMNRTLLSLTLTENNIGDRGTVKIAETLSRFPLTHEEVVMRRMLMSERAAQMEIRSPNSSRRSESKDRPSSVSKISSVQDKSKQKPSPKKKETKGRDSKEEKEIKPAKKEKEETKPAGRRESRASRGAQANQNASAGYNSSASNSSDLAKTTTKSKDKKKDKGKHPGEQERDTVQDQIHPLLEDTYFIDGQSWIPGNRILINLNLSRNNIGEVGMAALLRAIQYQTTLTIDSRSFGSGLLRLSVNKNAVSPDSETAVKLKELMMTKDPFYKPPTISDILGS